MRIWKESLFLRLYLKKYWKPVSIGLAALVMVDSLEATLPFLLKSVIDSLENKAPENEILKIAVLYFSLHLVQGIGRYGWRMYLSRTSMYAGLDLRAQYTKHLFDLSQSFYDRKKVGDLMSLATNDTEAVRRSLGPGLLVFADAIFYLLTIPVAMYILSPQLTLIAFIPLIFVPLIVLRNEKIIHLRFTKVQAAFSVLSSLAQENLMGIRVIKAFAKEPLQIKKFYSAGMDYLKINMSLARVQSAFGPSLDFILSVSLVLVLYFGGRSVITDELTIGTFVAFQRYIQKMIWPLEALGLAVVIYQRAVASSKRINQVLDEVPSIQDGNEVIGGAYNGSAVRIEIKNLYFTYPNTNEVIINNLSLTIEAGEKVAFVGSIGSGKSTLLSLLPRIYPVQSKSIFIRSKDINEWSLSELRHLIGFVPQDHFLFSESVAQNIVFGLSENERENIEKIRKDIESLTQTCAVKKDILILPQKFETKLGERGVNLSGGQKQRISIARALMKKPGILILDDSLSAVDTETENALLHSVVDECADMTQLIAAHRISTVKKADRIIVLEKGEIIDQGTHTSLIKKKSSLYYKFYEQQRLKDDIIAWTNAVRLSNEENQ